MRIHSNPPSSKGVPARVLAASLLRGVDPARIEQVSRHARSKALRADELLWRRGQPAEVFTVVVRGLVRVERVTPSGTHAILGLFGPRESLGETAALQRTSYPADAFAVSPRVDVVQLPASVLLEVMESDVHVARALQARVLSHTDALRAKIEIMSAGSVPARLASLFLHLGERFGDEDERGVTLIPVSLSRNAVAHLISARVETVIRTLGAWQRAGSLQTVERGFEISDGSALRALVEKG